MRSKAGLTNKDAVVLVACAVFLLAGLGAVGSTGRRRAKEAVCLSNLLRWGRIWKSYTDDHYGYFPYRDKVSDWPGTTHPYYENPTLLFCPAATRSYTEGGVCPFAAWTVWSWDEVRVDSSYCVNYWVAREDNPFWRTPYVADAAEVPLLLDGSWKDAEPLPYDEPPPSREWIQMNCWQPNQNEMKRVCHYRHESRVNGVFLDFSARKIGLKELWLLKWHRQWPEGRDHLPVWPQWMENFKDY